MSIFLNPFSRSSLHLLMMVRDFGFGERTGITLQSEVPGDIDALTRKGDIWSATASFGQGLTVTVLQLAAGEALLAPAR